MSIKKLPAVALSILLIISMTQVTPVLSAQPPQAGADDPNLTVISPRNVNYVTEEAIIGSLERSTGYDARLNYPVTMSIVIPRDGLYVGSAITGSNWVEEGDPIATFSVVANDLEIDEAALALELAESVQRREIESLEAVLNEMRAAYDNVVAHMELPDGGIPGVGVSDVADDTDGDDADADAADAADNIDADAAVADAADSADDVDADAAVADAADSADDVDADAADADAADTADDTDADAADATNDAADADIEPVMLSAGLPNAGSFELRRAELAVISAEENLAFAQYNGERNLGYMRARLDDLLERSEDFTVYAPITGYVYDVVYFSVGRSVFAGQFLCRISDPEAFQIVVVASNLAQLRLGATVSIETSRRDSPSFSGHVIGNTMLLGRHETEGRAIIAFDDPQEFLDFGEGSIQRIVGLRYRVNVWQADIQNVLLAPRRAVNTESSFRYVNILEDGLSKKRYVIVGLSNMEYAQILDGIKAGDVLIVN